MSDIPSPSTLHSGSPPSTGSSPPRRPSSTPTGSQSDRDRSPPTPSTPAPFNCDDFSHCRAIGGPAKNVVCDPTHVFTCPGLAPYIPTPRSKIGAIIHPLPAGDVTVCGYCMDHDTASCLPSHFIDKLAAITASADSNYRSGFRAQLCPRCIRDEVELYWLRQGTTLPLLQPGGDTIYLVEQWPNAPGSVQDLCICPTRAINVFALNCHACRDYGFRNGAWEPYACAEEVLTNRSKDVITSRTRCKINGGHGRHLRRSLRIGLSSGTITSKRANAGRRRRCPCGEKPRMRNGLEPEYITFCLSCSGVRIVPHNLPRYLRQESVMAGVTRRQGMRDSTKAARATVTRRTKGMRRALRNHLYRVNIESGWIDSNLGMGRRGDHWVGGF